MKCISLKNGMLKVIKKNQIVIFAIALMLVTAGYLNYSMNVEQTAETSAMSEQVQYAGIGDAKLVSNNNVVEVITDAEDCDEETKEVAERNNTKSTDVPVKKDEVKETVSSNAQELDSYFSESRLQREKMYSEMLESNQSILAGQNISTEQKNIAQQEISKISKEKNAIMIAENLIKNKGFKDIVIFVNNGSVSTVVRKEKLEEAEIAQIQSIIQRELGVNAENIHISSK